MDEREMGEAIAGIYREHEELRWKAVSSYLEIWQKDAPADAQGEIHALARSGLLDLDEMDLFIALLDLERCFDVRPLRELEDRALALMWPRQRHRFRRFWTKLKGLAASGACRTEKFERLLQDLEGEGM